eukprot:jgi/Chlat1/8096/Chrsp75S07551
MSWVRRLRRLPGRVVHEVREAAAPSSLPDPPEYVDHDKELRRRFNTAQRLRLYFQVWRESFKMYADSWKPAPRVQRGEGESDSCDRASVSGTDGGATKQELADELAAAAKAGARGIKPLLQSLYYTRATAYRDAVKSFVSGYHEGFAEGVKGEPLWSTTTTSATAGKEEKQEKESSHDEQPLAGTRRQGDAESTAKKAPVQVSIKSQHLE